MTISSAQETPPAMKQSRAKIWIRTVILAVFGTLFTLALYQDMASGVFRWPWALMAFLPCWVIGFWMRRWVPMQVHPAAQCITMSFDRIYFALILFLVIAKAITGRVEGMTIWADVIMCVILGLMVGRLSGICLRVRDLKMRHNLYGQVRETKGQHA
ncbi:MAG TPA: hypothetical protein PLJ35_16675 [Anaerolineae bacterium]|nr:hypothetical protein [Anaerolineae bacterium]HPL27648.1 hypothetical protein [Anaerolineae bacterium]